MNGSDLIHSCIGQAEAQAASAFSRVEEIERINTERVLSAFQRHAVAARHFAGTSGYGYGDEGRDTLDRVFADALGCEAALVRPSIASGTHALAACLFGLLRPGDVLVAGTGAPYDTLDSVIGAKSAAAGSLAEWGVGYREVALVDGAPDLDGLRALLAACPEAKVVLLQRSRGYAWRPSLSVETLARCAELVHAQRPDVWVMVDNCYGEFVEAIEPTMCGADVMAGSLIKNPGGGLAPTGGYIAGKEECVERAAARLIAPGIGREVGSWIAGYDRFYQGLFLAPHVVAQALKCALLFAGAFEALGYPTNPATGEARADIIQAIRFDDEARLLAFCEGVQLGAPVDSMATPVPWDMPGYSHPVIMAAGAFVGGASIELSADAPVIPPYIAYMQGGLTYAHGRIALERTLAHMAEKCVLRPVRR